MRQIDKLNMTRNIEFIRAIYDAKLCLIFLAKSNVRRFKDCHVFIEPLKPCYEFPPLG